MKTPLGTEVDIGAGHIVLNGFPALCERGTAPLPIFQAHVCCGHGRPSQLLLSSCNLIMAALWNRAGHYIFILWFLSSIYLSSFPRLISPAAHWMSTIIPHKVLPYCEFRMQVWNVLHAARWKYRTQKVAKNRHLGTIAQLCQAISSQLWHVLTIGKTC